MSGINPLRDFLAPTKTGYSGEIGVSQDDKTPLENKGTLGQRVLSFFKGIGEALGFVKGDSEHARANRAGRQSSALEGFREALKRTIDEVRSTLKSVDTGRRDIKAHNTSLLAYGARDRALRAVTTETGVNQSKMQIWQIKQYTAAFEKGMEEARKGDSVKLSEDDVRRVARQALESIENLPRR